MSPMSPALSERIVAEHAGSLRARAAAGASAGPQRAALEALLAAGLPTQRDENWKYANLRPLEKLRFAPALAGAGALATLSLPQPLPHYLRFVFIDGAFASDLSASPGATTAALSLEGDALDGAQRPSADERFALLNAAFATQTASIRVPARSAGPVLLELVFVARAESAAGASYPRLQVQVERGAELALIERHVSAATAPNFVNSAVRIEVAPGASLTHYRLQHLSGGSIFFDTLSASLGADAAYRLHAISTGAQSARSTLRVRLEGERADLTLACAALGDHHQVQDTYAVVEHLAPNARTEQTFRGIAAARARVAFNGKIIVASAARGTDSRQSLRGLLAGPEAEIDVRPQLEIYTDEVRCSHGATAGKLDANMLFYLLARGLTREAAQRLLKWAFLGDVLAKIELPELRHQIEERLVGQLHDDALQELL
jgi:Fe-S cluster assembly protein SufD